jgi:membrane complex biogenesis BtpA family protein
MSAVGAGFASPKPVIGMIHVGALPGTPAGRASMRELEAQAVAEARVYRDGGVHGIAIENMHDVPYLKGGVGPEITAAMTILARAVKAESGLPCGIQILAGANHEALAVAHAASLDFVRVEGFAFAHVADEGIIESSAASLLRFRRAIGAERVQVWADVKKKHSSHAITADVDVGDTAAATEFMRADAVIVTGAATGEEPDDVALTAVRQRSRLPLYIGSGLTADNLSRFAPLADGFIVGSYFKQAGRWSETVDPRRVERFMSLHGPAIASLHDEPHRARHLRSSG